MHTVTLQQVMHSWAQARSASSPRKEDRARRVSDECAFNRPFPTTYATIGPSALAISPLPPIHMKHWNDQDYAAPGQHGSALHVLHVCAVHMSVSVSHVGHEGAPHHARSCLQPVLLPQLLLGHRSGPNPR